MWTLTALSHEERVAFWVNMYNALVMHAHLVYGSPHSNMRRAVFLQQSAYLVGGFRCSAAIIERTFCVPSPSTDCW